MTCSHCATPLPANSRFCVVCGADLSDPEVSTRQRAAVKELFEAFKEAVERRYRVSGILGRGGMGAVFLAEDLRLGRMVALKVLRPELADEPGFLGRFEREARISAQLDHPNIIPIYEVAQAGDFEYFAMKHVTGKSVDELLEGKPLPVEQARQILWQAACGLGHAHRRGVVHRDVKPPNIMVEESGRVIITDFGISKALQSSTQYTSTGQIVGTPRYVSPEQAQGLSLDGRSDQYSLAVVGYQMLVGRLPLVADTVHVLLYKHIYEVPVPASSIAPIPQPISDALQRALAKKPEDRFPSIEDFATALWPEHPAVTEQPVPLLPIKGATPHPPSVHRTPTVRTSRSRRRRSIRATAGVLVIVVIGLAMVMLGQRRNRVETGMHGTRDTDQAAAVPLEPPPTSSRSAEIREPQPGESRGEPELIYQRQKEGAESALVHRAVVVPSESAGTGRSAPTLKPKPKPARSRQPPAIVRSAPRDTQAGPVLAPKSGYLTVNAIPYGTVSIDGVEIGDTPIFRHEVSPGEHRIRIAREAFRTDSTVISVTAGNEVRLSRTLVKESK
jgi:serine/threonine-protein kinase